MVLMLILGRMRQKCLIFIFLFLFVWLVVRTAAPQQEGPELLLLSVFVWVLSGFLPESRDMQLVGLG